MSSWRCLGCRTVHADGIPGCPNCEGGSVAKVSAAGATCYVADGAPVPGDLPAGVRMVGPGAPGDDTAAPEAPGPPRRPSGRADGRRKAPRAAMSGG